MCKRTSALWLTLTLLGFISAPAQAETEPNDDQASAESLSFFHSAELVGLSVAVESGATAHA